MIGDSDDSDIVDSDIVARTYENIWTVRFTKRISMKLDPSLQNLVG